jgi:hypothetical protein
VPSYWEDHQILPRAVIPKGSGGDPQIFVGALIPLTRARICRRTSTSASLSLADLIQQLSSLWQGPFSPVMPAPLRLPPWPTPSPIRQSLGCIDSENTKEKKNNKMREEEFHWQVGPMCQWLWEDIEDICLRASVEADVKSWSQLKYRKRFKTKKN